MKKRRTYLGLWTTDDAEARFRDMEDELAAEVWPDPPTPIDIETHVGPTRAYRWSGDGDPVVFLHGLGATSLIWADYVGRVDGRTAYTIDNIGDVGRSRQLVPAQDNADLADWLDRVIAGLGERRVHLVGMSYGGFLALNQAVRRTDRVRSVTLLEPVGLAPFRFVRFLLWGMLVLPVSWLPARCGGGPAGRYTCRRSTTSGSSGWGGTPSSISGITWCRLFRSLTTSSAP